MEIEEELVELNDINHCGFALLQYAVSLPVGGGSFSNRNGRWVCEPNFVTFEIHYKRSNNIRISLRGNPEEYQKQKELPLKNGMGGYSEFSFESSDQLYAASAYIRRAWQIFNKGRNRNQSCPVTVDE